MPQNASDDFLEIIHRRYGSGATLIATNRPVEDWGKILGDKAATSSILDRFLDGAQIVPFKGKSYRLNRPKQRIFASTGVAYFEVPADRYDQFHVGGINTLRGFSHDAYRGKSEIVSTFENRLDLLRKRPIRLWRWSTYMGLQGILGLESASLWDHEAMMEKDLHTGL